MVGRPQLQPQPQRQPPPGAAATGGRSVVSAAGTPESHTFLEVLTVLYLHFNPAKLGEVPVFAHKYV